MKQNSNSSKMELDWAWNQPQEVSGIKLGKDDTYKEKTTWLAWEMKLEGEWALLTCFKKPPKM
jgi:hypothetical protein